ncbi:MAG: nitroreductase family protein [Clostridiales bacterium]|nr:nitroreductase family protein [Clostridiales bacterium]
MNIIKGRRTIRKYKQDRIDPKILKDLADGARLAPSGANLQPLEYLIVDDPTLLDKVFDTLAWAGYIKPEGDPKVGERPVAYIIILVKDKARGNTSHDAGAAIQNILLGAWGYGIGCCWIGSVKRDVLAKEFSIPKDMKIDSVISLGYPAEESIWEDEKGSIKYYYDEDKVLHVPKRKPEDIIHLNRMTIGVGNPGMDIS